VCFCFGTVIITCAQNKKSKRELLEATFLFMIARQLNKNYIYFNSVAKKFSFDNTGKKVCRAGEFSVKL